MANPKQVKSNRGKVNAIEKDVKTISNSLQTTRQGAAIAVLAAFTFIFMGLLLLNLHERSYEQKIQKQFDTFKEEVTSLTYQHTSAIKNLNELVELIKPLAQHREIQLLDYYRNEIWKWEENQRELEAAQKKEEEAIGRATGNGRTERNDAGTAEHNNKPVQKNAGSDPPKKK